MLSYLLDQTKENDVYNTLKNLVVVNLFPLGAINPLLWYVSLLWGGYWKDSVPGKIILVWGRQCQGNYLSTAQNISLQYKRKSKNCLHLCNVVVTFKTLDWAQWEELHEYSNVDVFAYILLSSDVAPLVFPQVNILTSFSVAELVISRCYQAQNYKTFCKSCLEMWAPVDQSRGRTRSKGRILYSKMEQHFVIVICPI